MAIAASSVLPSDSLEDFRIEFNNLVSDVTGITATNKFDSSIIFEGSTADAYETTLTVTDPTADRTITIPNATGTLLTSDSANPASSDGAALGSTSLEWSDLYLADGGIIYFGDDQDINLTHVADTGLTTNGDFSVGDDLKLTSDAAVLGFGADNDVTLTHVADTGILLNSTMAIQFNDASQYINAPSNAILDINATDEIELNATLADVNANLDVSGTYTGGGLMTTGGNIVIPDAGNIGSASDTDAIAISSGGVVTFSQNPVFPDGGIPIADLDIDGGTDIGEAIVDADLFIIDNGAGGTNRKTTASRLKTYISAAAADPASADGDSLGTASAEWSDLYLADGGVIYLGNDQDVTLTHVADTGILLNSTMQLQFNDSSQYINAPSATVLDINATDEIELNATLADINANLDVSGTYTGGGLMTTGGNIVIPDAGNIGSASDTNAISISSGGVVAVTATTANTSASDGALTVGGGLGVAADASIGDDLRLISDAAVLSFGADSDVTVTHVADTGILLNSTMAIQFNDASQYINAPSNAILDINATDEIELNATAVDLNGTLDVSGATTTAAITASGIIKTDDATEATSTTDGSLQTDGGLSVVKDAVFGDDVKLLSDSAVLNFGADSDVTITHAADASLTIAGGTAAQLIMSTGSILPKTDTDTSNTGSVTLDFKTNQNFVLTFTGNVTLANPSTETAGQSGVIVCIQDGTGSRTLSLGTDYETAGGAGITLSTAANAVDVIPYFVKAAGSIQLGAVQTAFS